MTLHRDSGQSPRVLAAFLAASIGLLPIDAFGADCPTFKSQSEGLPTHVEWRTRPDLADVNGDGRLDLAANPRKGSNPAVWTSGKDGSWEHSARGLVTPGFSCGVGVDFADFNGDGHVDLGVADHCKGLFVYRGDGTGRWRLGKRPVRSGRNNFEDLAFTDINGDGHQDIIAVGAMGGGMVARLGDGAGNWKRLDASLPRDGAGFDVEIGDLNEDGRPDVVSAFSSFAGRGRKLHMIWLNEGGDTLTSVPTGLPDDTAYWGVGIGDANGDGHLDIAAASNRNRGWLPIRVLLGDGSGKNWKVANEGLPAENSATFYDIDLADLNGDGRDELIASVHDTVGMRIWSSSENGEWQECTEHGIASDRTGRGWGLSVGDVNGDGLPDIALAFGRNGAGGIESWIQQAAPAAGPDEPGRDE